MLVKKMYTMLSSVQDSGLSTFSSKDLKTHPDVLQFSSSLTPTLWAEGV